MPVTSTTSYFSVGGQILAELTAGSTRVDYVTDALGSVVATASSTATVLNQYTYSVGFLRLRICLRCELCGVRRCLTLAIGCG